MNLPLFLSLIDTEAGARGLVLMVVGMGVVFIALLLVMAGVTLINKIGEEKQAPAESPAASPSNVPATPSSDGISPEVLVAISAAVAATVGTDALVRRVKFVRNLNSPWGSTGRSNAMRNAPGSR